MLPRRTSCAPGSGPTSEAVIGSPPGRTRRCQRPSNHRRADALEGSHWPESLQPVSSRRASTRKSRKLETLRESWPLEG